MKICAGDVVQLTDGTYDIVQSVELKVTDDGIVCPPSVWLKRCKHAVTEDDIAYTVTGTHFCASNQILLVNDVDDLSLEDWDQFISGFRAWSVHKKCMNSILARCNVLNIQWDDGESATNFNPFEAFEKLEAFDILMLRLLGNDVPDDSSRCLLCVHGKYLMFTFNQEMFG
jgi:hypothetical protein